MEMNKSVGVGFVLLLLVMFGANFAVAGTCSSDSDCSSGQICDFTYDEDGICVDAPSTSLFADSGKNVWERIRGKDTNQCKNIK